ncbi:MAG: LacI family DNA-binding transcriptional regulator [Lachnospiraceae bacterium]|nr:LacI family DNA-binding transcriptional regulator [Lachnospiraceae bacterium]
MSKQHSSPTMKDVAREAGVALGTVSKVINGIPVGESYRIRVEEAIQKLNYRINNYAKGLKSNKTFTIAVMVPNLISPYFCRLVSCINKSLVQHGYRMLLCATDYDPEQEQAYVIMAEQQKVDGIICLSYNPELKVSESIPFISIDRYFGSHIPCVASDNYGGGKLAAEKLAECGCKNLAFLKIGSRLTNEPSKRKDGFVNACESMNLPYTLKIVDDGTPYAAFENFLSEHIKEGKLEFDGIFCVTDSLAYQIINTLKYMNINVPEDVQVIGFDGIRQFGDLDFYCSTIVQPVEEIADVCVGMILNKEDSLPPSLICLPVTYAFGGTTKQ